MSAGGACVKPLLRGGGTVEAKHLRTYGFTRGRGDVPVFFIFPYDLERVSAYMCVRGFCFLIYVYIYIYIYIAWRSSH